MTARTLFSLSLAPMWKSFRRWWIKNQITGIGRDLEQIRRQRENDRHAERVLQGRQALLHSELINL